jgi:hypothetical protein
VKILAHYTLTPAEALRGTRIFQGYRYATSLGSGAVLVLAGLAGLPTGLAPQGLCYFLLFLGLLFLVMPEAALRWARRRRGAQAYPPMAVVLDDEGLTLQTEASEGGLPWSAFAGIQRRGGIWIFRVSHTQAVLVPERALDAGAGAELEAFLRARLLLRG